MSPLNAKVIATGTRLPLGRRVAGSLRTAVAGVTAVLVALPAAVVMTAMLAVVAPAPAAALDNGVARTPPMGWNTWNTFGCNINETLIRQMADAIVSSGMRDLGYQYVVVDDCWFNPNRDSAGQPAGRPGPVPQRHAGARRLPARPRAEVRHLPGAGWTETCAQYFDAYPGATGSQGHEAQDARQFAAWGVDYLKYDWCSPNGTINDQVATFAKMRDALAATGRPIVYSINPNSIHEKTGPLRNWGDVANMWRTTEDITNAWDTGQTNGYPMGIQNIVNVNVPLASLRRARAGSTTRT